MWIEVFFLFLTAILLWRVLKKPSGLPPGPWGLPLLGYIPLRTKAKDILKELNQKYGDIIFTRIGSQPVVLLYDYILIREALSGPEMVDSPDIKLLSMIYPGKKQGIISTNGDHWHQIRRFSLRQLRYLGMGKSKLVDAIQQEAMELVKSFQKAEGKPISLPHSISTFVLNIIWQMVANEDLLFCLADLFGAGTETSTSTLEWSILYLATHPDIQSKIHTEIDQVLKGSLVTIEDKARFVKRFTTNQIVNLSTRSSSISISTSAME